MVLKNYFEEIPRSKFGLLPKSNGDFVAVSSQRSDQ